MATYEVSEIIPGTQEDINDDLNGECFIAGAEGEPEKIIENNIVLFPAGYPAAADNAAGTQVTYTSTQMAVFLTLNAKHSLTSGRTANVAARVAYIRFLAARNGLISPSFTTNLHNVRYNHAKWSDTPVENIIGRDNEEFRDAVRAVRDNLSATVRREISAKFTNLVCCVAYMFRVRGHHYMADFQDRYITLWARCLYKPEELPLDWEFVATDALHAVMPDVLDAFWINAAEEARCAGTLIKRLDSAPAGSAGVVALERGLNDVTMLFPAVVEKVPDAHQEFKQVVGQVKGSRWGGSINARFYGASRQRIDEAKIGALASVVLGIYEHLAPQSQLRNSMALKRLAEIAPATGGAIGIAAGRAARDERLNLIGYSVAGAGIEAAPE